MIRVTVETVPANPGFWATYIRRKVVSREDTYTIPTSNTVDAINRADKVAKDSGRIVLYLRSIVREEKSE